MESVTKIYEKENSLDSSKKNPVKLPFKALKELTISLQPDEILGLIGPNGAGKSTFFHIIEAFATLDSGKLFVKNKLAIAKNFQNPG